LVMLKQVWKIVKDFKAIYFSEGTAHGMPVEEAIKAMTLNPAQVFGFADKFGSIEAGKLADLVIWTGHPLELLTRAQHVIIGGRKFPWYREQPG